MSERMASNASYLPSVALLPRRVKAYDRTPVEQPPLTKEEAPCCTGRRDAQGRLPIGFCSPGCLRRPGVTFEETNQ